MPSDRIKLLAGPYRPPRLRKGARAFCFYRDTDIVITSWTNGRIPWPRGRALDLVCGMPSYLVDEELLGAIRNESTVALMHWFGVGSSLIARWRAALGVTRLNNPGSVRANEFAIEGSTAKTRGSKLSRKQVEERRKRAIKLNLAQYMLPCSRPGGSRPWTAKELRAIGKAPDKEVAAKIGRTESAIRSKRFQLGIPRPDSYCRPWTAAELALLGTDDDEAIAEQTGRTAVAVRLKRDKLGIPRMRDRRRMR